MKAWTSHYPWAVTNKMKPACCVPRAASPLALWASDPSAARQFMAESAISTLPRHSLVLWIHLDPFGPLALCPKVVTHIYTLINHRWRCDAPQSLRSRQHERKGACLITFMTCNLFVKCPSTRLEAAEGTAGLNDVECCCQNTDLALLSMHRTMEEPGSRGNCFSSTAMCCSPTEHFEGQVVWFPPAAPGTLSIDAIAYHGNSYNKV